MTVYFAQVFIKSLVIDQLSPTHSSECLCIKLMVQQSSQPDRQVIYLQSGKRTDNFIVLIFHFSWVDALTHADLCASVREYGSQGIRIPGSILKFKKLWIAFGLAVIISITQVFGFFFFLSYLCSASLSSLSGRPMMSATDLIVS